MQDGEGVGVGEHFNVLRVGWMLVEAGLDEETDFVAIYLVRTGPVGSARPPSTAAIARLFTETSIYPQTTEGNQIPQEDQVARCVLSSVAAVTKRACE